MNSTRSALKGLLDALEALATSADGAPTIDAAARLHLAQRIAGNVLSTQEGTALDARRSGERYITLHEIERDRLRSALSKSEDKVKRLFMRLLQPHVMQAEEDFRRLTDLQEQCAKPDFESDF